MEIIFILIWHQISYSNTATTSLESDKSNSFTSCLLSQSFPSTCPQSLCRAQPAVIINTYGELEANGGQSVFIWLSHRPLSGLSCLSFTRFCFCSPSLYLSTWITPALEHTDRIACMRCLNRASLAFSAPSPTSCNDVHVSKENCSEPQSQLRSLKQESKGSIEQLTCMCERNPELDWW